MRLIDGDVVEKDIRELLFTEEDPSMLLTEAGQRIFNSAIEVALFEVAEAEVIDAAPVVHARWAYVEDYTHTRLAWHCSKCGRVIASEMVAFAKYCPSCGAKMDGGAEG